MKRKWASGILGGSIGLVAGVVGGGYLGLILGGTFLGGLEIYRYTGLEGYELTAYFGATTGAVIGATWGVKLAKIKEVRSAQKESAKESLNQKYLPKGMGLWRHKERNGKDCSDYR